MTEALLEERNLWPLIERHAAAAPDAFFAVDEVERGLAKQKLPERLELADALPRNASGKVLNRELQQRYR